MKLRDATYIVAGRYPNHNVHLTPCARVECWKDGPPEYRIDWTCTLFSGQQLINQVYAPTLNELLEKLPGLAPVDAEVDLGVTCV